PSHLRHIKDPPFVLYALGNTSLVNELHSLSVIGTRAPTEEAYMKTKQIISPLIKKACVIASGMAYGIDSMAHEITLQLGGRTIAILGSGFEYIYPRSNRALFHQIVAKGLVLTEYPPTMPARKYHFPESNRIISGITKATLVIEAKERSGTLITVDQALDQGKDVYAVPGSPLVEQTVGCHRMIQ